MNKIFNIFFIAILFSTVLLPGAEKASISQLKEIISPNREFIEDKDEDLLLLKDYKTPSTNSSSSHRDRNRSSKAPKRGPTGTYLVSFGVSTSSDGAFYQLWDFNAGVGITGGEIPVSFNGFRVLKGISNLFSFRS